jgi:multidrug efflux pump subunit AcrA (membrane-fusion protein)
LQVELQVDNPKRELFPGAYAIVHLNLASSTATMRLPVNTILFRANGLQVATLGGDRRVSLKPIVQGRDFGTEIEVLSGVGPDDDVVVNPPDSITDGAQVRLVEPAPAPRQAGGGRS